MLKQTLVLSRDNDNPEWGRDTISLIVDDTEVRETFTVDGVSDTTTSGFSSPDEAEEFLRLRRLVLENDGYRED